MAIGHRGQSADWRSQLGAGGLGIVLALVVLAWPGATVVVLATALGLRAIAIGLVAIAAGWKLHRCAPDHVDTDDRTRHVAMNAAGTDGRRMDEAGSGRIERSPADLPRLVVASGAWAPAPPRRVAVRRHAHRVPVGSASQSGRLAAVADRPGGARDAGPRSGGARRWAGPCTGSGGGCSSPSCWPDRWPPRSPRCWASRRAR